MQLRARGARLSPKKGTEPKAQMSILGAIWNALNSPSADRTEEFVRYALAAIPGGKVIRRGNLTLVAEDVPFLAEDESRRLALFGEPYAMQAAPNPAEGVLDALKADKDIGKSALRLDGPFQLILQELRDGITVILRDPLGQADLFVTRKERSILFSDSIPLLAEYPGVSHEIDRRAVSEYFALGYVPAPATFFQSIERIPARCSFTIDGDGTAALAPYWTPAFTPNHARGWEETVEDARRLLETAIDRRLAAYPDAGFTLSGGVDSGTILGTARRLHPDLKAKAYTIAFEDESYDESRHAAIIAEKAGVALEVIPATPEDVSLLDELVRISGEPFADSSLLASALCQRKADSKCLFTGDGGDEFFGGYRRYQAMVLRHKMPGCLDPISRSAARIGKAILPKPRENRTLLGNAVRGLDAFSKRPLDAYASFQRVASDRLIEAMLPRMPSPHFRDVWAEEMKSMHTESPALKYNLLDIMHYLPDDGCRKQAIAAAYGKTHLLAPLMDRDVREFALTLPMDFRQNSHETKRILRNLAAPFIPPEILALRKRGFGVPLAQWFRAPLAKMVTDAAASTAEWDTHRLLNPEKVRWIVERHTSGKTNLSAPIWALLCLRAWEIQYPA